MKNFKKISTWFHENYNLENRKITKYDYVLMGVAIGAVLAVSKSILLVLLVMGFLAHKSFGKK